MVHRDFFTFESNSSLQYLEIIGTKHSGLLGHKDGLIRFAHDLLASHMERTFELAIDKKIAAIGILQKYHPRAVLQNGLESRFAFAKFFLSSLPFGAVQKRGPPMGHVPCIIVNHEALEIDAREGADIFPEMQLTGLWRACLQDFLIVPVDDVLIFRCKEAGE